MFGTRWRPTMRPSLAPRARAAATKSRSFICTIADLATRAKFGTAQIPIAMIVFGEPGCHTLVRQWLRPTVEVNGIGGGYQGPGSKTVIPSEAFAKVSCRLVPGQDPGRVLALVVDHLRRSCPPGVELEVEVSKEGAPAYVLPGDDPFLLAAEAVLEEVFGRPPVRVGMGGSVPIVAVFR